MLRHGAKQQLKSLLKYSKKSVIAFMKTLSPSGVELSQTKSHLHVSFHKWRNYLHLSFWGWYNIHKLRRTKHHLVLEKMHRLRTYSAPNSIIQFIASKSLIFCLSALELTIFFTQSGEIKQRIKFTQPMNGMMQPLTYFNKLVFWSGK